jgi:hypothetical protein
MCAATAPAATPVNGWVGEVAGTRTFVGLVERGGTLSAYACDGRRIGRWFEGRRGGRRTVLRAERGGRLVVHFGARRVAAVLELPKQRRRRAVLTPARGRAGLFRRERIVPRSAGTPGARLEGWVRLNDGRIRGIGLAQTLGVRRPRPGLEVFLRPATGDSPALAPVGAPPADARLQSIAFDPCAGRGTTCGLPVRGMRIGDVRRSARTASVDDNATISAAALARILAEAPLVRAREKASVIAAAGLIAFPPGPSRLPDRNAFDAYARALVADTGVIDAATALRRARTVEARSAAADLLTRSGRRIPGRPLGEIDPPEFAISETGNPGTLRSFTTRTIRSGAAVTEEVTLEGPDAEVRDSRVLNVVADVAVLSGFARAGFHSRAEFSDTAHVEITVPPGARAVDISFDAGRYQELGRNNSCLLGGTGGGMTWRAVALWARDADGTYDIGEGTPVDGIYFDFTATSVLLPLPAVLSCIAGPGTPPLPPFQLTTRGLPGLRIANPPPQGGRFLITVEAGGEAHTIADGRAETEHRIGISSITVKTEF